MLQARTMWLQTLFPRLPFQPSVGALISLPLRLPNLQIQPTWPPIRHQLWAFNLRTFLWDPITVLYYVVVSWLATSPRTCLLLPLYFQNSSWPQPPECMENLQTGSLQVYLAWRLSTGWRMGQVMHRLSTSQSQSPPSFPTIQVQRAPTPF